jgi:hypothetical protein
MDLGREKSASAPARVVRTYGRGSFLAFLSPLLAWLMASRGMNGWERSAEGEAQRDALVMEERGYRVVDAREYSIPALGIAWIKVTYEHAVGNDDA